MDLAITAVVSIGVGLVVGMLSGMLGIGGGTVLVPVFKLGFLLPPIVCTGTSLFVVVLSSVSGAITHVKNRTCLPKIGIMAGIGGACMSPIGVWLASMSPDWAIMVAAALVIAYSSITMFRKALKAPKGGGRGGASDAAGGHGAASCEASADLQASGAKAATPFSEELAEEFSVGPHHMAIGFAVGLVAGLLGGYVGVGGGFIMVPLFMSLLKMPIKVTSGTSLIAVFILAIPGVITQGLLGNVAWMVGILVAVGSMPGAVLGARLMERMPERTLRFLFAGILCFAAIMLVVDQL